MLPANAETSQPPPNATPEPSQGRRAAFIFVFITVVLDMLALGMIIPVLPKLVLQFLGGDTARAAEIYGLFGTVWAMMQFLFSPVMGSLSDRFGRRPVILLSNIGLGLDYILMALAPTIGWLFAGRVISGITAASVSTAGAYIADVTPPEQRAAKFGMLGAAFGIGFVLGPALGGVLGGIDPRLPFWVAACLSLLNASYGLFVLPESLPRERRSPFAWKRANPIGALRLLRSRPGLLRLATITFLGQLAHAALPSTFVLYAGYRYGWNERDVGLTLAGVGICSMIVQGGLVQPLVKRFGERRILMAGLTFGSIGFAIYGLAPTSAIFLAAVPFSSLWGLANPPMQSLMSRLVGPNEQGQLQGASSSVMGIAHMLGPVLFTLTFAHFIAEYRDWELPGAPFLLASLMLASALIVAQHVTQKSA